MAIDVILGLQWGDEGKGKIVDYLAKEYDLVCRFQGGPNAGHTIKIDDSQFVLHTIPSGIFREGMMNLIGNGVVIDPIILENEMNKLSALDIDLNARLVLSEKAHLILPTHRYLDAASEAFKGKNKIGSTLRGIGPTYMDKTGRNGLRIGDLLSRNFQEKYQALKQKHLRLIKLYPSIDFDLQKEEATWMNSLNSIRKLKIVNGEFYVNDFLSANKQVLAEGAQGSMLDIDYGTYPFVTSSNTITSGVCNGLGVAPQTIREVIGITKAYCTRVGSGPFPTELSDLNGEELRKIGREFGATTGRPRRCGWLDLVQLKYTIMLNGVTQIVLTKLDVLNSFSTIKVCEKYKIDDHLTERFPFDVSDGKLEPQYSSIKGWNSPTNRMRNYEELATNTQEYIQYLEEQINVPIKIISVGPERQEIILKNS